MAGFYKKQEGGRFDVGSTSVRPKNAVTGLLGFLSCCQGTGGSNGNFITLGCCRVLNF